MYLVGVYGIINMMRGDDRVQGVCAVREYQSRRWPGALGTCPEVPGVAEVAEVE
jgi:hypothetical protein